MEHTKNRNGHPHVVVLFALLAITSQSIEAAYGWAPAPTHHQSQQQSSAPGEFAWVPPTTTQKPVTPSPAAEQSYGFVEQQKKERQAVAPGTAQTYGFVAVQQSRPETDPEQLALFKALSDTQIQTLTLASAVATLLKTYQPKPVAISQVFGFATKAKPVVLSAMGGSPVNIFDKKIFAQLTDYLGGDRASYLTYLGGLWSIYGQQFEELAKKGNKDQAQRVVVSAFSSGSFALEVYSQLVGQILNFIKMRISSFSLETFGQSGAQYFLTTELPALDALVQKAQASFDTHFKGGVDGFPAISPLGGDASVYKSVFTNYQEQKGILCANFAMTLAQSLATSYPPSLAMGQSITKILNLPFGSPDLVATLNCLDKFYQIGQQGLGLLNQKTPQPPFGVYKNPYQALQAISGNIASFYLYAALIGQNVITASCKTPDCVAYQNQLVSPTGGATQNNFYTNMQTVIACTQSYYQSASQYYAAQLDSMRSDLYNQVASYFIAGNTYWKNAEASLVRSDFPGAINAYQSAADSFKRAGNTDLSTTLSRRSQVAALAYYQMLLQSYAQFYQLNVPNYVQQMTTPLSDGITADQATSWHTGYPNGFIQFFYYDAAANQSGLTPTFQGIAWLAGQAIPSYTQMLNAYQSDTSPSGAVIRQNLQQSLVVLENVTQAAQAMFYNDDAAGQAGSLNDLSIAAQHLAANANIGSGTVQGATQAELQYIKIYELFTKADAVLAQGASTALVSSSPLQLPFQNLFTGQSVNGFAQFSCLAQVYWSLLNIDPCLALAKQHPSYASVLASTTLILLTQAQALCGSQDLKTVVAPSYADAITAKIKRVVALYPVSLVATEGDAFMKVAKDTLDFESAIACYRTAALLGDTQAQLKYTTALDTFATWYIASSHVNFSSFYAAIQYYRAYLAKQKGWAITYDPLQKMTEQLKNFVTQLTDALGKVSRSVQSGAYLDAISQLASCVTLQDEMNFMMVRQKREQGLLGVSGDFLNSAQTTGTSAAFGQIPMSSPVTAQPVVNMQFPLASSVSCPPFVNPLSNTAQLYLAQGQISLKNLKKDFEAGKYASSVQKLYEDISKNFSEAIDFFGKSNEQEMILVVQQAITEAAAFAYYSTVIPSKKITDLLNATVALKPSFSADFVTSQVEANASKKTGPAQTTFAFQEPASPVKKPTQSTDSGLFGFSSGKKRDAAHVQDQAVPAPSSALTQTTPPPVGRLFSAGDPDFLIRYVEQDLTVAAQQEKAAAPVKQLSEVAQKQAQEIISKVPGAKVIVPSPVPVPTHQGLLSVAEKALGVEKRVQVSPSSYALVSDLVVPLYRLFLVENGYQSELCPLDDEVNRYSEQVTKLVTQGMAFDESTLFTSYALEKRTMPDKTEHIILITTNGPLQAVPRFQGELQSALVYYMQYSQFYAYNPQVVQVGGSLFYQIEDHGFSHQAKAFKAVIGAYLAQVTDYENAVRTIMKSAPNITQTADRKKYAFADYEQVYHLLTSAYTWLLSGLDGIGSLQEEHGIFWISSTSFNALNAHHLQRYMKDSALFLLGYPLSAPYKKVLQDISALGILLSNYISDQTPILKFNGGLYEDAADLTLLYPQAVPAINSFPSPAATNLPIGSLNLTTQYPSCSVPRPSSGQAPATFDIFWGNYDASSKFYLVAFQKFQEAYLTAFGDGNVMKDDVNFRRSWGNYIRVLFEALAVRVALFGRNSTSVTLKTVGQNNQISFGLNPYFSKVIAQGQATGTTALQGFAALQGGAMTADNSATLQNQYTLMRGLLLDSFIYGAAVEKASQAMSYDPTGKEGLGQKGTLKLAAVLRCAFAYYMPGMQVLRAHETKVGAAYEAGTVGEDKTEDIELATPVLLLPLDQLRLDTLGGPNLTQLAYAKIFPAFVDYCLGAIMGTEDDPEGPYTGLTDPENISALNNFASQLYAMVQSLYANAFLPQSVQNDPDQLATDIKAAIQAREQDMIINPEAYVG